MKFKKLITTTLIAVTLICATAFSVSAKTDIANYKITNATDIQKHLAGLIELSDDKQKEYDFNNDGVLSIIDSTVLRYSLAELELPIVEPTTQPTTVAPTIETTVPITKPCPSTIKLDISSITLGVGEMYTLKKTTDMSDYPFTFTSSKDTKLNTYIKEWNILITITSIILILVGIAIILNAKYQLYPRFLIFNGILNIVLGVLVNTIRLKNK